MRVYRDYRHPLPSPTVVAIGNFDGVHLGHAALLARLVAHARRLGLPPTVLTFEPHPREFFSPQQAPARLSTLHEKLAMLAEHGVEQVLLCRFNERFASLSAEAFLEQVLGGCLQARQVLVGDDFRFGRGRQGDFSLLQAFGAQQGFGVASLPSVMVAGERASSSGVRDALARGDMAHAASLLGRPYMMDGRVVHGDKIGRQLGFATANIRVKHNPLPMTGVFAVEVGVAGGGVLTGVANLGIRPTVGGTRPLLEVHLFDFSGDLYGRHLSVRFVHRLRAEQRFPDFAALKAQIACDVADGRAFFLNHSSNEQANG